MEERNNNLNAYFKKVDGKFLTKEEEYELFTKLKNGDPNAFDEIVEANILNVIIIAKKIKQRFNTLDIQDIIADGNHTLMMCVDKFDISKGLRFYSYLQTAINNNCIKNVVADDRTIRIPYTKLGSEEDMRIVLMNDLVKFGSNGEIEYSDILSVEDDTDPLREVIKSERVEHLYKSLDKLRPSDRLILYDYFGLGDEKIKLVDMAKAEGVTKGCMGTRKFNALEKMKKIMGGELGTRKKRKS